MLASSGYFKCDTPNSVYYNLPFCEGGDFKNIYIHIYLESQTASGRFRVSKGYIYIRRKLK